MIGTICISNVQYENHHLYSKRIIAGGTSPGSQLSQRIKYYYEKIIMIGVGIHTQEWTFKDSGAQRTQRPLALPLAALSIMLGCEQVTACTALIIVRSESWVIRLPW